MIKIRSLFKISSNSKSLFSPFSIVTFSSKRPPVSSSSSSSESSSDLEAKKQPFYVHKANYNFEHFKKYTREVNEALSRKEAAEKVEVQMKKDGIQRVPRRQRRLYDRPRHDLNLEGYGAWRAFDSQLDKADDHSLPVVCKIPIAPAKLIRAFGLGDDAESNSSATREYNFEDNNFDLYLLYDYRGTTEFWGPNKEDYDYEEQGSFHPNRRIRKYPTVDEFWKSEEDHFFRVNCTRYADFRKFKKWILTKIEENEKKGIDFEQSVIQKFGPFETFDDYNKNYDYIKEPAVFAYTKNFYLEKGEKSEKKTRFHDKIVPAKDLGDAYILADALAFAEKK